MSASNKKLLPKVRELQKSVKSIKSEMSGLRQVHTLNVAEFKASMGHTSQRILAAISAFGHTASLHSDGKVRIGTFRKERVELYGLKDGYKRCCESTFKDLE